jgi:hypothetical protein
VLVASAGRGKMPLWIFSGTNEKFDDATTFLDIETSFGTEEKERGRLTDGIATMWEKGEKP